MKVGVYLIQGINPSAGGNFSYYDKLINAIDTYNFTDKIEVCFVGRVSREEVKLRREYFQISPASRYRMSRVLKKLKVTGLLSRIFSTNADLCNRSDLSLLKKASVDLILYPKQFFHEVDDFPFMTMNWDAGHKSTFMFPEFLDGFETRENWYQMEMQKSLAVIVESQSSKEEFSTYFAIPESKIEIVPLFPGGVVDLVVKIEDQDQILRNFNLDRHSYFFYPAQFWAHKNHYNLVLAFKKLVENNPDRHLKLVFTGSDKGNKGYILSVIKKLKLEKDVLIFGFVSNEEVYSLYKNSIALVMPTFLGPTNMPLLEARDLNVAVICSDLKGHREMCGNGALYADPTSPDQWYISMASLLDNTFRETLIKQAGEVRQSSLFTIDTAIKSLEKILVKFIPVRKTFY